MKFYTGIGSRATPDDICELMTKVAAKLSRDHWTLRSGGADGADLAFEKGAANKEIFLPWKGFNGNESPLYNTKKEAFDIAEKAHPNWPACRQAVKKLHARNVHQVLGQDLKAPSQFVVCWTPNAELVGGTRTALVLAQENDIPIFNLALPETFLTLTNWTIE